MRWMRHWSRGSSGIGWRIGARFAGRGIWRRDEAQKQADQQGVFNHKEHKEHKEQKGFTQSFSMCSLCSLWLIFSVA